MTSPQHLQNFRTLQSASLLRSDSSIFSNKSIPEVTPKEPKTQTMGLILKAYDDCRQDTLALQVMRLLQIIWEAEGIDIPLIVYNVTPARTSTADKVMGGIIECVRDHVPILIGRSQIAIREIIWERRDLPR